MPASTSNERRLASQIGANLSWANTPDRGARTAPARRALEDKFLAEAGGDPKRAASLRKVYYQRLALRSAQARRRARETARVADKAADRATGTRLTADDAARAAAAADAEADAALAEFHDDASGDVA